MTNLKDEMDNIITQKYRKTSFNQITRAYESLLLKQKDKGEKLRKKKLRKVKEKFQDLRVSSRESTQRIDLFS